MGERGESLDKVVIGIPRQDENESRLVGDNLDGDASGPFQPNRRKFNRHNANQIQQLEAYFKENPHPDEKARLELGMKLSMDSSQVKSWFQNRRTQRKSQLERCKTRMLKEENDKLRMEHIALKKAMRNPTCDRCSQLDTIGGINVDEHKTNIEHDRLQDEVKWIKVLADKLLGPSAFFEGSMNSMMKNSALEFVAGRSEFSGINVVDTASPMGLDFENGLSSPLPVISPWPTTSLTIKDVNYDMSMLMDLAFASMNELLKLADTGEPLWVKSLNGSAETSNLHEYARLSTTFIDMKPGHFITEATRASGTVLTDSLTLVETLTDKSRWMETFSCIIGKTSTFDVISTGIGGSRSGTLLLIQTELQIISDLVPVRETKFLRFCQRHDVGWAIVDVSVDTIQKISEQCQIGNCRRLPSGCIVRDMPNGYSQVTWIEHVEYNENFVHHLYQPLVRIGLGFGALRWLATLQRQSNFSAVMMSSVGPTVCTRGQRSIRMLTQRMIHNFCAGVCTTIHKWKTIQLPDGEDAKLMIRKNISDPGEPIGLVLSATKTIWLPMEQQRLYEFLMNEQTRSQWDVLSSSGPMQPMLHIFKGQNFDSSISLFRANGDDTNADQQKMLILQDTCTDATGSLLVYAPIDCPAMNVVMNGGDSSSVALLPSGIAIVPDHFKDFLGAKDCNKSFGKKDNCFSCSGSLVTIGFQVLVNSFPATKLSMESAKTVNDLISCRIHGIKTALKCK